MMLFINIQGHGMYTHIHTADIFHKNEKEQVVSIETTINITHTVKGPYWKEDWFASHSLKTMLLEELYTKLT